MKIVGVIPARMAASRLPGKPLLDIAGKPMVQWVWERASKAQSLSEIYIATPDAEIIEAAERFGAKAMITSHNHRSGTDRTAEVARRTDGDAYVNVQGDEPMLDPDNIDALVAPMQQDSSVQMASVYCIEDPSEYNSPAVVSVVMAQNGDALYFSRSRIPYPRETTELPVYKHLGLYAYRRETLLKLAELPPTPLERTESLEQLRALEHGIPIRMSPVKTGSIAVDTEDDLHRARELMAGLLF